MMAKGHTTRQKLKRLRDCMMQLTCLHKGTVKKNSHSLQDKIFTDLKDIRVNIQGKKIIRR